MTDQISMPERIPRSEKDKQAISAGLKGRPKSPEHRAALSAAKKGKFTDAQRAAVAATHARWKEEGYPTVGIPKSPEAIEKMSLAKKGKYSDAQRVARKAQFAKWKAEGYWPTKGVSPTPETREKIRQAQLAIVPSKLKRYGITTEEYLSQKTSGNEWCWFGKHFVPQEQIEESRGTCEGCKAAAYRTTDLKKKYGVTPEWYMERLAAQGGGCAICGCATTHTARIKYLMIDHDHDTGEARGILCMPCNTAIERMETVSDWETLARSYLDKHQCSTTIQPKT